MSAYGFTEQAMGVLQSASDDAVNAGYTQVSTNHFLRALLRVTDGVTPVVLRNLHVDVETLAQQVARRISATEPSTARSIGVTLAPNSQKVIQLAMAEARHLGHDYIGTEHLLLGLLRDGTSDTSEALSLAGAPLDDVRAQTQRVVGERSAAHGLSGQQ